MPVHLGQTQQYCAVPAQYFNIMYGILSCIAFHPTLPTYSPAHRSWQERLRQAEARKQEESKQLEKSGVAAVKVDNQLPNLVNLNEDPQLSELLLYVIKTGQTRVGQKRQNSSHDIQLSGALIADNHW